MIKIISLFIAFLPAIVLAGEKITFYSDMVVRKCEMNSVGEKVCLGDFSNPNFINLELKDSQFFSTGSWQQEFRIGNHAFVGKIVVSKNLSDLTYYVQLQIQGDGFNPKTAVTLKDLKNPISVEVKDDSLLLVDENGQEWSPSLYLQVP